MTASQPEEIPEKVLPNSGQDRLGVELDSLYQVVLVAKPHHLTFGSFCRDLQAGGKALSLDQQAVVAGRLEGIRKIPEEGSPVVVDQRGFPVHEASGPNDPSTKGRPYALVS